jgi:hypothetical protein
MARLAGVRAGIFQGRVGFSQLLDGVQLPGKVVEPDAATHFWRRVGAYPEEAGDVVVAGARRRTHGPGAGLLRPARSQGKRCCGVGLTAGLGLDGEATGPGDLFAGPECLDH